MQLPTTLAQCLRYAVSQLATTSPSARRDAELLLQQVLQVERSFLYAHPEIKLKPGEFERFLTLVARRASGEPIAYIRGRQAFWNLELEVTPATLIPRPETELLVELALSMLPKQAELKLLDLGTGSGAIALALASERPQWEITATDVSSEALAVAKRNADSQRAALTFCQSDWFSALAGQRFDVIVSNPPYLAALDAHLHAGDLRFEPRPALVAGPQGLEALRIIILAARGHLAQNGLLLLEHGYQQSAAVVACLQAAGFAEAAAHQDYNGHLRVASGVWRG